MLKTAEIKLSISQLQELDRFGQMISGLGANFVIFDTECQLVRIWEGDKFTSCLDVLVQKSLEALEQENVQKTNCECPSVNSYGNDKNILAVVLKTNLQATAVAVIDLSGDYFNQPGKTGVNQEHSILCGIFSELLGLFARNIHSESESREQIESVSTELAQVYEELVLLHKLSTNMHLTEADGNFLQMSCDSLTDIVNVEGIAILLEKTIDGQKRLNLAAGSGLIDIDELTAAVLHDRLVEEIEDGKEALLDSEVDSPFRYDWPDNIRNIIVVPLFSKDKGLINESEGNQNPTSILGLLVAINRLDKQDFDSTDIKLFTSVAGGCAVFIENGRLFKDLKDLFIGSLRALTNSIDAKDRYTRGHSERVAFISKWIADRLVEQNLLKEEEVSKIYLAGLLHDIGKMGIEEVVLRKNGKLTEQEMYCIKTHPSVGASILSEIKQMRDIVPGVLCHHEREDGRGYPNGIKGDQIPLVSKIIALADSFDAMTSKRTYRDAMSVKQAINEIEKALGSQFDETVGRVFIQSDIYRLWDIIQKGFTGVYEEGALSEYGTLAVGTLLK
ncbi:MAG: HD-GYP domain-containing protein [Planctomycetota bacterium]|jgi:HD-GYP domain-containing protein (c-di-GMP phosphodiesterase class II)